jgi:hypothetical protein
MVPPEPENGYSHMFYVMLLMGIIGLVGMLIVATGSAIP